MEPGKGPSVAASKVKAKLVLTPPTTAGTQSRTTPVGPRAWWGDTSSITKPTAVATVRIPNNTPTTGGQSRTTPVGPKVWWAETSSVAKVVAATKAAEELSGFPWTNEAANPPAGSLAEKSAPRTEVSAGSLSTSFGFLRKDANPPAGAVAGKPLQGAGGSERPPEPLTFGFSSKPRGYVSPYSVLPNTAAATNKQSATLKTQDNNLITIGGVIQNYTLLSGPLRQQGKATSGDTPLAKSWVAPLPKEKEGSTSAKDAIAPSTTSKAQSVPAAAELTPTSSPWTTADLKRLANSKRLAKQISDFSASQATGAATLPKLEGWTPSGRSQWHPGSLEPLGTRTKYRDLIAGDRSSSPAMAGLKEWKAIRGARIAAINKVKAANSSAPSESTDHKTSKTTPETHPAATSHGPTTPTRPAAESKVPLQFAFVKSAEELVRSGTTRPDNESKATPQPTSTKTAQDTNAALRTFGLGDSGGPLPLKLDLAVPGDRQIHPSVSTGNLKLLAPDNVLSNKKRHARSASDVQPGPKEARSDAASARSVSRERPGSTRICDGTLAAADNGDVGVDRWFADMEDINERIFSEFRRQDARRVKIGILDTGIDMRNTAFQAKNVRRRIKKRVDFADPEGRGVDVCGHGTHCAALINRVAPAADIYIGRVTKDWSGLDEEVVAKVSSRTPSFGNP